LAEEGLDGQDLLTGPVSRGGVWADRAVEGTEWLVERRKLAAALCANARSAGADCRADVAVDAGRMEGGWRVRLRSGGTLAAPLMIEARGRRGAERRGPLLLAFGQQFRQAGAAGEGATARDAAGTQIHVADFGWCWWAVRGRTLWIQVVGRPRARHPAAWLAAARAQVPALAHVLARAVPDGAPTARPAHARLGPAGADPTLWRVGDAALALDPLSGQGVYEAVRGARLVATALRSVLDGGDAGLAQRFVTARQQEAWAGGVRIAAGFYGENRDRGVFWADTAAAYERLLPDPAPVSPGVQRRPVLHHGRILEREVIVTAEHPRGVWHVDGVPLVSLKGYLDSDSRATAASAAAALGRPEASVAAAIHWLHKTGVVRGHSPPRVSSGG
jgi:2-polyprenyl-6-methoxyphenol hydroxylase-like FAD-dependent oxidoreductase